MLTAVLDGPFRGSTAMQRGAVTPRQLRGPRYHRLFRDVYLSADVEVDFATRSRAAYLLVAGHGGLAGHSAAELLGASCAPREAPAEVYVTGGGLRSGPDLLVHRDAMADGETRAYRGVTLTTARRTAFDLARRLDLVEAVVAVDALAGRAGFAPAALLDLTRDHPRARGRRRLPAVVDLADPEADSPMETRLRLVLVLHGLPRPVVSHVVRDERWRTVAWLDLAYPDALLGIEYDGDDHRERGRFVHDLERDGRLAELGWEVLRFTARDVYLRPEQTAARVRRVLEARRARRRS